MRAADSLHCGCARKASVYKVQDDNGTSQTHVWCSDCFHERYRYDLKGKTVTLTEESAPRTLVIYAKTAVVTEDMHPVQVIVTRFAAEDDHPRWTVSKLRRGKVVSSKLFSTQQDALAEAAYIVDHLKLYKKQFNVAQSLVNAVVAWRQKVLDAERNVGNYRNVRREESADGDKIAAWDAANLLKAEQEFEAAKNAHKRACVAVFE